MASCDTVVPVLHRVEEIHLEVTRNCNLRCAYCYASKDSETAPIMEPQVAQKAIRLILRNTKKIEFTLCFHGGEPLLAPPEWLDTVAANTADLARVFGKRYRLFMQTNATLVNEDNLSVIKKHQILVGSSLDGPPSFNNQSRGLTEKAIQGIRALSRAGLLSGVMVILSPRNVAALDEVFDFLQQQGLNVVQVNFVHCLGRVHTTNALLTTEQMLAARRALLRRMLCREHPVDLGTFRIVEKFLGMSDLSALNCTNPYCHAGIKMVLVDARGRLFPCGLSANLPHTQLAHCDTMDMERYRLGLEAFHRKGDDYAAVCAKCGAARICSFGCPAESGIQPAECAVNQLFYNQLLKFDRKELYQAYEDTQSQLDRLRKSFPYRPPGKNGTSEAVTNSEIAT